MPADLKTLTKESGNAPPTPLSREERWKRIARFKNDKKPRLNYEASKKVAYQSRKKHADGQPRIGGRFVSKKMLAGMAPVTGAAGEAPAPALASSPVVEGGAQEGGDGGGGGGGIGDGGCDRMSV